MRSTSDTPALIRKDCSRPLDGTPYTSLLSSLVVGSMRNIAVLPPIKSQVPGVLMDLTAFKEISTQDLIWMARALPGGPSQRSTTFGVGRSDRYGLPVSLVNGI